MLKNTEVEVIVLDLLMPYISGKELLPFITKDYPHIPVIILTAVDDVENAVECMKSGAFDYMVKPVEKTRFVTGIKRAIAFKELQRENRQLKKQLLTDARIIAATNHNIATLSDSSKFRKDLFYRISTHQVDIPPLRKRIGDLPLLLDHFIKEAIQATGRKVPVIHNELLPLLSSYSFPGNVRELEAMVLDAIALHKAGSLSC